MPDRSWLAINWAIQGIEFEDNCGAVRVGTSRLYVEFDGDHKGVEATVVIPDDPEQAARMLAVVSSSELNGPRPNWGDMSVWHEGRRAGEWVVRWRYSWRSSRAEVEKAAAAVVAVLGDGFGLSPDQVWYRSNDDSIPGREDFYFPSDRPTDRGLGAQAGDWTEFTTRLGWVVRTLQHRAVLILRVGEAVTVRFQKDDEIGVWCDQVDVRRLGGDSIESQLTALGWVADGETCYVGGTVDPYDEDPLRLVELAVATLRTIGGIDDPRHITFEAHRDVLGRDDLWYIDAEIGISREPGTATADRPQLDEDSAAVDRRAVADAVEYLTDTWIATLDDSSVSTVISGAALWPLLAVLLGATDECGDNEQLQESVGIDDNDPLAHAALLLELVRKSTAVEVSVGMWHSPDIEVEPQWAEQIPDGVTFEPWEPEQVHRWASERTGELVTDFRQELDRDSPLVMMSALTMRTSWAVPFVDIEHVPASGPWMGTPLAALRRLGINTSLVWSSESATCALVVGTDDINVLLVAGSPGADPATVLASGSETLAVGPSDLEIGYTGPCITVTAADSRADVVEFIVPRFTIRAEHDLLGNEELSDEWFGEDGAELFLPLISEGDLVLGEARQLIAATFTATGFGYEGPPAPPENISPPSVDRPRHITVCLDRPFGFLVIQRSTALVLGAGWVADPELY